MFKPSCLHAVPATALGALFLAMSAVTTPVLAQSGTTQVARTDSSPSQRLSMGVGKSVIIDLPRDAAEIFVGNPAVANAVVRSPRKIYVIGAANGQTTIFALDARGSQIAKIDINIGRDVGELQRILKAALPTSDISARTVEDSIILTGVVATAGDAQKAVDIANGFVRTDGAQAATAGATPGAGSGTSSRVVNSLVIRGRDQVMLKVTISEVQRQVIKQLGITAASASGGWGQFVMDNPLSLNLQNTSSSALTMNGAGNLFHPEGVRALWRRPHSCRAERHRRFRRKREVHGWRRVADSAGPDLRARHHRANNLHHPGAVQALRNQP